MKHVNWKKIHGKKMCKFENKNPSTFENYSKWPIFKATVKS